MIVFICYCIVYLLAYYLYSICQDLLLPTAAAVILSCFFRLVPTCLLPSSSALLFSIIVHHFLPVHTIVLLAGPPSAGRRRAAGPDRTVLPGSRLFPGVTRPPGCCCRQLPPAKLRLPPSAAVFHRCTIGHRQLTPYRSGPSDQLIVVSQPANRPFQASAIASPANSFGLAGVWIGPEGQARLGGPLGFICYFIIIIRIPGSSAAGSVVNCSHPAPVQLFGWLDLAAAGVWLGFWIVPDLDQKLIFFFFFSYFFKLASYLLFNYLAGRLAAFGFGWLAGYWTAAAGSCSSWPASCWHYWAVHLRDCCRVAVVVAQSAIGVLAG